MSIDNPGDQSENYQKQKLETLGLLTRGIVHDLNNILTGILGHVSYVRLSVSGLETYADSLQAIEDGGRRAAALCQKILEFARGEMPTKTRVDLVRIVDSTVQLLRTAFETEVSVSFQHNGVPLYLEGDEGQIAQVVINLVVNAREAVGVGGEVEIFLDRWQSRPNADPGPLATGTLSNKPYIRLAVCDNGRGISPENRDKLFQENFSTKSPSRSGFGLATVGSIVRSLGGAIRWFSREGAGSMFEVFFPELDVGQVNENHCAPKMELPRGDENILVVDDEEPVRTVIQRSLEHLGYKVVTAASGIEAVSYYQEHPGDCDLVVLDMMMPTMSGEEVFFRLKEMDRNVKVLIASGYITDERASKVLNSGGSGFLRKPFSVEELASEVRRCLDRG